MRARILVLFAREPRREAREKGFVGAAGEELFAAIAAGWLAAAREARADLAVAAPPEDLGAWRRAIGKESNVLWIPQRGGSFGSRLEGAARRATALGERVLVVGGDVVPSPDGLAAAFDALDSGAEAVLAPAPDGGVSMLAVPAADADLLAAIRPRRRDVCRALRARLLSRGRKVVLVAPAADVDGRSALRALRRGASGALAPIIERALARVPAVERLAVFVPPGPRTDPATLRGPPVPA